MKEMARYYILLSISNKELWGEKDLGINCYDFNFLILFVFWFLGWLTGITCWDCTCMD